MIDRFGLGVGHLNYLAVPGVGIFEFLFVSVTTNHFLGWRISVIFDLTFLPGGREFSQQILGKCQIPPYAPPTPTSPAPAGLTLIGTLRQKEIKFHHVNLSKQKLNKLLAGIHCKVGPAATFQAQ